MSAKKANLITSCPACSANFYVTPEQLSVHRGDVRCGKCNLVFNALDRLSESSTSSSVTEIAVEPSLEDILETPAGQHEEAAKSASSSPVDDSASAAFNIVDFSGKPSSAMSSPKIATDAASKTRLNRPNTRKPSVWLLALLGFMFALLATAQVAYYMRTQITAQWPALRPHFDKACKILDCTVELPKQIESLAIDDSDLQEDAERQGLIHLASTIINNAAFTQAYPLLELTLTDTYDKPVLRRAFTPLEYLPAGTNISKGFSAGEEIHVKLALTVNGEAVAGYRVFATYLNSNENH